MAKIISKPNQDNSDAFGKDKEQLFGYFETTNIHHRDHQEDTLVFETFNANELVATEQTKPLKPKELAHRLWTTYRLLDEQILANPELRSGTTASTVVYDGQGNLVTATLADAVSFAVVYGTQGEALGVIRLNSITHKPSEPNEKQRIEKAGGTVIFDRVNGRLAVSRAIGDRSYKGLGVCSEANIDITNLDKIVSDLNIDPKNVGSIQVITTCDGFTDAAEEQTKEGHEQFLLQSLQNIASPDRLPEEVLAKKLVECAKGRSYDNISVAVKTIAKDSPAFMLGIYDGHAGSDASCYVADHIGSIFKQQCALTTTAYAEQALSVDKNKPVYKRDNAAANKYKAEESEIANHLLTVSERTADLAVTHQGIEITQKLRALTIEFQTTLHVSTPAQVSTVANHLLSILDDPNIVDDAARINAFYEFLASPVELVTNSPTPIISNIDFLKQNTSIPTSNFLLGLTIVALTLATAILPGLLIAAIVYAVTDKHPLQLFSSQGKSLEKELIAVKQNNVSYAAFFQPTPAVTSQEMPNEELEAKPQAPSQTL